MKTLDKIDLYKHKGRGTVLGGMFSLAKMVMTVIYGTFRINENRVYQIVEPIF
jgi:hypothetical protein